MSREEWWTRMRIAMSADINKLKALDNRDEGDECHCVTCKCSREGGKCACPKCDEDAVMDGYCGQCYAHGC